ncbi:MAG: metal ABC transporter permease [Candidatus Lokiarchaeota archaeon]|nr:metal ABC transporter permease [Candidatus Lokiarchaeota archaeon]
MLYFVILPTSIMIKIILSAVLAGFALSLIGTFVVHMKITSVGFTMSHTAFAGAALGLLLASYGSPIDPVHVASVFTILIAFLLGPLSNKTKLDSNIILGIMFSLMIALGFIFISQMPEGVTGRSAMNIIWGSLFGLNEQEMIVLIVLNIVVIVILILFFKEFMSIMLNEKVAQAAGIPVNFFKFLVLLATAIAVSFSINIIGAFLVYAMIVNPSSTAHQYIYDTKKLFIVSPIIGVLTIIGGIFLSLTVDFPISSSIIIFSSGTFAISVIISPKRKKRILKKQDKEPVERSLNKVRMYFNEHAQGWDEQVYHDPRKVNSIVKELKLQHSACILDVGTGTGITLPFIGKHITNGGKIVAMDISETMISIAKKKYGEKHSNVEFVVGDVNDILYEGEFDAILCYSCFPHFLDQEKTLNILVKALKPDGHLMVAHSQSRKKINSVHKNVESITSEDRLPPMRKLKALIKKAGLQVIKKHDSKEMFFIIGKKVSVYKFQKRNIL